MTSSWIINHYDNGFIQLHLRPNWRPVLPACFHKFLTIYTATSLVVLKYGLSIMYQYLWWNLILSIQKAIEWGSLKRSRKETTPTWSESIWKHGHKWHRWSDRSQYDITEDQKKGPGDKWFSYSGVWCFGHLSCIVDPTGEAYDQIK